MTRCGYVAIVGAPNAGKSTLLNCLVGGKIAAVTPKAQTTRNRITGICMHAQTQIVFLDTPGIFDAKQKFEQAMVQSAWESGGDADAILMMLDAKRGLDDNSLRVIEGIKEREKPLLFALNKIDLVEKEYLLSLAREIDTLANFEKIFMISAQKGSGVEAIKKILAELLPEGPYLYPEDQLGDISERLLASEITREKCFLKLKEELPYALSVETETWEEQKNGSVKIRQIITVQRESQKTIVIGRNGEALKRIGSAARHELGHVLGRPVHLFLFVKVQENWKESPSVYDYLGLEFNK